MNKQIALRIYKCVCIFFCGPPVLVRLRLKSGYWKAEPNQI